MIKSYKNFLTESKNTHLEHIEDNVLNGGVTGTRSSINFLRSLRDMLSGHSKNKLNITVKWDGAPAVFAGTDPTDGKFFVAKKGIFNKNPKVYKTEAEVRADTSGDLADKLSACLKYLPEIGIKGVIQGDLMFTQSDLHRQEIAGESYIMFHPNTIAYAVPEKSQLGKTISSSKIGVVFHTKYTGDSFEEMKASFGGDIKGSLKPSKNVWFTDATYHDISGTANMTAEETASVNKILGEAGSLFQKMNPAVIEDITQNDELLLLVKTFNNSKIRNGELLIVDGKQHMHALVDWIVARFQKEQDSKKTEKAKQALVEKKKLVMHYFTKHSAEEISNVFTIMKLLIDAKHVLLKKLNNSASTKTFLKTKNGYVVTNHEGYVAIDHLGSAVKIVDRLEFSAANFSPEIIKGWQR